MKLPMFPVRADTKLIRKLEEACSRMGFTCELKVFQDRIEGLQISDNDGKFLFWMGPWTDSWILCFFGPRYIQILDTKSIEPIFVVLLEEESRASDAIPERVSELFELKEISAAEWSDIIFGFDEKRFRNVGWHRLSDDDERQAWQQFSKLTNSDGGIRGFPWIKWKVKEIALLSEENREKLTEDLHQKLGVAMLHSGSEKWTVLDANHPCYIFRPQEVITYPVEDWPLLLYPNDDPICYISSNFESGVFSDLESQITAFGASVLESFTTTAPRLFDSVTSQGQ